MKKIIIGMMAAVAMSVFAEEAKSAKKPEKAVDPAKVEARAMRMVKNAVSLFEEHEDDRGVAMLEGVIRLYPDSKARFNARLELGRHFLDKRNFDRAAGELRQALLTDDSEMKAEIMFLQGQIFIGRSQPGEALMVLRRLTKEYPTSQFSNDAFFQIGNLHFEASRWTRAGESFQMVGTAVPATATNEAVLAEAGQRVFAHVNDKDLVIAAANGEKSYVIFTSKSGDEEKAELTPFGKGDGDFIAGVRTAPAPSQKNDGVLTVRGGDDIKVKYVDVNTEDGTVNRTIDDDGNVVSSASIAFMDGAKRQRVRGIFIDQPAVIRMRDFDLDTTDQADSAEITLKTVYRERPERAPGEDPNLPPPPPAADAPWLTRKEYKIKLIENGPRTGVFEGTVIPSLKEENGKIFTTAEDKIIVEYVDKRHIGGTVDQVRSSEVAVLVGGSTEPQSVVAHSSEATIQARKLLIEAQLLHKWGAIFKDVGLMDTAKNKAEEGLGKITELFELDRRYSIDRTVLEEAYEAKWNLHIVEGALAKAIETCRALVKRYPDTVLADRAFMQIALAKRESNEPGAAEEACSVFRSIISLPNSQLKAEAQFRIGETLEDQARKAVSHGRDTGKKPNFAKAIEEFRRCAEGYPSSSFAGESYKRMIDWNIQMKTYTQAEEILERVFQDYPDAPWLDDMLLKWGVVLYRNGKTEDAQKKFQRILEEFPGGKAAEQAKQFLRKLED